jgi:hypothetical protein
MPRIIEIEDDFSATTRHHNRMKLLSCLPRSYRAAEPDVSGICLRVVGYLHLRFVSPSIAFTGTSVQ